jgi:hypothetical protein
VSAAGPARWWRRLTGQRGPAATESGTAAGVAKLDRLLPLLRCPVTHLPLRRDGDAVCSADGLMRWPVVEGRPVLFPGMTTPVVHPVEHLSNPLPDNAVELIRRSDGWVLNLSAGGTAVELGNVVEAEAGIFRHTAVVADAHALPFIDGAFAAVVTMNAFEHYRDPALAAREIFRVLRPGGKLLARTAFLQPLHEAPWHFYNCTKYGLLEWFKAFETVDVRVSDNFAPSYAVAWLLAEAEAALRRDVSPAAAEAFLSAPIGRFVAFWRNEAARADPLWTDFAKLSQATQEGLAAGFEYVGTKPG